jgi:Tfp pilus assembly protein PilF
MLTQADEFAVAKRRLILRDSLAILTLTLVTLSLFAITLFLFRSFTAHRAALAQSSAALGARELAANNPAAAILDLRSALAYAPGARADELLLAQALGEAGHLEESYTYFLGLSDTEPGNGFINLELARLAARRNDSVAAVNFYSAAINGTWQGDGVDRRAEVRIEFARYLIQTHHLAEARMDLLIVGGNAPDDYDRDMDIASLFEQAADPADAATYYHKAAAARPNDPAAIEAVGRLAYQAGDFETAHKLLARAQQERAARHEPIFQNATDPVLLDNAARILELSPSPNQPPRKRVDNILAARDLARRRLDACSAQLAGAAASSQPSALASLAAQWAGPDGTATAASLLADSTRQQAAMQLVYDTELQTANLCAAPAGDDALLLILAQSHAKLSPGAAVATQAVPAPL